MNPKTIVLKLFEVMRKRGTGNAKFGGGSKAVRPEEITCC